MNPVVSIRADRLLLTLTRYARALRRGGSFPVGAAVDAHWEAQRLRSVCERELGTRVR